MSGDIPRNVDQDLSSPTSTSIDRIIQRLKIAIKSGFKTRRASLPSPISQRRCWPRSSWSASPPPLDNESSYLSNSSAWYVVSHFSDAESETADGLPARRLINCSLCLRRCRQFQTSVYHQDATTPSASLPEDKKPLTFQEKYPGLDSRKPTKKPPKLDTAEAVAQRAKEK